MPPEFHRTLEQLLGFLRRQRTGNPRICVTVSQSKDLRLAFLEYEIGGDSALTILLDRYCRAERQAHVLRLKNCATRTQRGFMSGPSIIESRTAQERNAHRAPHTANPTKNMATPRRVRWQSRRHEVFQFRDAICVRKASHQDVRRGPIELLAPQIVGNG